MPVRSIQKIFHVDLGSRLLITIPKCILNSFDLKDETDRLYCEFLNLYKEKSPKIIALSCKINEHYEMQFSEKTISLSKTPIGLKYGFVEGEYLELVYREIIRGNGKKRERIPIFPARTIEDICEIKIE